jgi:hypothetical protein
MTDAGAKNAFLFKTLGRSYQSYLETLKLTEERIKAARLGGARGFFAASPPRLCGLGRRLRVSRWQAR